MSTKSERRRPNGRRIEGQGLAAKVAQEITGTVLAHAYAVVKSAGFGLRINKLDGVPRGAQCLVSDEGVINVDVIGGIVRKGWASLC